MAPREPASLQGSFSPDRAAFRYGPVDAGYRIDGIWPVRTELPGNLEKKRNALASPMVPRREFVARLLQAMPGCRVATAIARDLSGFVRATV